VLATLRHLSTFKGLVAVTPGGSDAVASPARIEADNKMLLADRDACDIPVAALPANARGSAPVIPREAPALPVNAPRLVLSIVNGLAANAPALECAILRPHARVFCQKGRRVPLRPVIARLLIRDDEQVADIAGEFRNLHGGSYATALPRLIPGVTRASPWGDPRAPGPNSRSQRNHLPTH
jgi:hypothetical protein